MGGHQNHRVDVGVVECVLVIGGQFETLLGGEVAHTIDIEIDHAAYFYFIAVVVDRVDVYSAPPTQADYGCIQHASPKKLRNMDPIIS